MEYALLDTPAVCSNVLYNTVVKDGETALLARDVTEWEEKIDMLVTSESLRRSISSKAKAEVLASHNLNDHWNKWLDVYKAVVL